MERSFGHDLSAVRIHRGVASARLAEVVGADAFTVGSDIHFGRHRYAPGTRSGDRLLAHELVHVVAGDADCVRRRITFDTKRFNTARTAGGRIRAHWKGDEIATIKAMVRDYQAVNDATKRRSFAQLIEAATASWLADHGDEPGKQVQRLKSAVEDLHAETQVELSRLEAEDRFVADAQGGDLRQLTHKAKSAIGVAQEYAAGTATTDRRREMDDLLRRYGISQAEFLAMRAFSSGGFKYMNPATANDRERMTRAFPLARQHPRRQQELMEEGSLSSAVAIEGLRKMPPTRGVVMRGERMSQAEFEARFSVGRRVPILSLTSTTYMDRVAREFAAGNATAFRR